MSIDRRSFYSRPDLVFLLVALTFGVLFAVFIPYGAGFDEEEHVIRIYDIAAGNFLPNQPDPQSGKLFVPIDFLRYSYQRRFFQTPAFDLFSEQGMYSPLNPAELLVKVTRSIYSPFNFLPQAVVARLFWRKYHFPVVPVAILCRIAGFLTYLGLTYFAIRLLPAGKWVMVVLALAPSALFQAATLNADGFTNGVSFVFTAVVLHLALGDQKVIPSRKIVLLILSILLVGTAKPGFIVLFFLLFLLPFRRFPSRRWILAVVIAVLVAVVFSIQYNSLAVQYSHFAGSDEGSLDQQIQRILDQPGDFIYTLFWGNLRSIGNYFTEWVAVYGHWVGSVPAPVYVLFTGALVLAIVAEGASDRFTPRQRLILIAGFLISSGFFAFLYTVNNYVPGSLSGFGHQGRYYIPTAPLLWLALVGLVSLPKLNSKRLYLFLFVTSGAGLLLYLFGMYATYYTYCGSTIYTFRGCIQPEYKNIEWSETPGLPLSSSTLVSQEFPNRCGRIDQFRVYVRNHTYQPDFFLNYALKDADGRVLYRDRIPVAGLPVMDFFVLDIPSHISTSNGTILEIEPEGDGEIELALNGGDYFREAHLYVNHEGVSDDLLFRYVCEPFWKQVIGGEILKGSGN